MNEAAPPSMSSRHSPKFGQILLTGISTIIVLVCVGTSLAFLMGKKSPVRDRLNTAFNDPGRPRVDSFYDDAPRQGNVLLRFHDFTPLDDEFLGLAYYRSVYLLYPQKVFATEPTNIVNYGRHLLQAPLRPSAAWLEEHSVSFILDLGRQANGGLRLEKTIRSPATK